jgi:type II secretory pathway pseudopilin PulG
LVVIAIIAILAAILFPVFAQAKAAAKKAASISNNKQNALAVIMYSADYDDVNPVYISWVTGPGAPAYLGSEGLMPWSWNVQPYMKNVDILQDPQAPPIKDWPAAWGSTIPKGLSPIYGYNYTFLSAPYGLPNNPTYQPIASTALAEPANTVMLSAKWSTGEWNYGATTVVCMAPLAASSSTTRSTARTATRFLSGALATGDPAMATSSSRWVTTTRSTLASEPVVTPSEPETA